MPQIANITDNELSIADTSLMQRYGEIKQIHADHEHSKQEPAGS